MANRITAAAEAAVDEWPVPSAGGTDGIDGIEGSDGSDGTDGVSGSGE